MSKGQKVEPMGPLTDEQIERVLGAGAKDLEDFPGEVCNCDACRLAREVKERRAAERPRPLDEWHEDDGPVLWWRLPVDEPPWAGTPLDSDWQIGGDGPGGAWYTHWTPLPTALAGRRIGPAPPAPPETTP